MRLDPDEKLNQDEPSSIVLNSTLTSPKVVIELPTKSYVDSLDESSRNKRDLSSVLSDHDKEFINNKLTSLDSNVVNRIRNLDYELSNKKYVDVSIREGSKVRFIQTLRNYLENSVGNNVYKLT